MSDPAESDDLLYFKTVSSNKIIDFKRYRDTNDSVARSWVLDAVIGNPQFEDYLKEVVKGMIFDSLLKGKVESSVSSDNPFDSVYIADLSPDKGIDHSYRDLQYLNRNIEDRSDNLFIDDNLDG